MKNKGILILFGGLLVGVLLGAIVFLSGPGQAPGIPRNLPPTIGSPVADFELPGLNGDVQRLSNLKNKPVVVNFWATWCPPCKEEMPLLNQMAQEYSGNLVVLGINYAENEAVVREFISTGNITFPILLDETGQVANLYFVRNYPTTFFIDADGMLRAQHIGLLSEDLLARYLALIGIE